MPVKSFRDLRVWQAAMELVEDVYRITRLFPKEEVFGLSSQLRRGVVSVASNIAEGHTREHTKEYLHHLSMAQASVAEVETQIEIANRLNYVPEKEASDVQGKLSSLGKQLYALRNALVAKPTPGP